MGIVDVHLYGTEQVLDPLVGDIDAIEQILVLAAHDNLARYRKLLVVLESRRALVPVPVVKSYRHRCLVHTRLTAFVDQILQRCSSYLSVKHICVIIFCYGTSIYYIFSYGIILKMFLVPSGLSVYFTHPSSIRSQSRWIISYTLHFEKP